MSEIGSIEEALQKVEERYSSEEKIRKKLASYNDPIELTFLDTSNKALILVNGDQGIDTKFKEGDDSAPVKIEFESEQTMLDLLNKKIGAVGAYSSGKIKVVEGKIRNLLKLRKLLF